MTKWDDAFDKPERPAPSPVALVEPARASRYAAKALASECSTVAGAPNGQRNHTLNTAAFSLSQLVAAGALDAHDVVDNLTTAAHMAGLEDKEIEATIASGMKAGVKAPRVIPESAPQAEIPTPTVLSDDPTPGPPLNPIVDWHELFASDDDGEEWIIEPLLPARRMVALYSAPKAGKSLLMLEIAVGIARGTTVIGATPDRPRRVLYVDFENDMRGDVLARLESMEVKPDELGGLCYLTFPSLAKFDTAQGAVDLMRHVDAYDCEVVVIDTVSRAVMGEENENDTWLSFYRHTGLALKRAEVACIRLDHSGKDREKGMRGGSAKSGDVDAVWRLTALSEDTIQLECTDHRMPVPVTSIMLTREDFPLTHVMVGADDWRVVADAKVRRADELLDRLGVPSSASVRDAKNAVRAAGERVANVPLQEAVKMRKLRLDVQSSGVPGTPPVHPGTSGGSVPGTPPPLGGVRYTSGDVPNRRGTEPPDEPTGTGSTKPPAPSPTPPPETPAPSRGADHG